MNKEAGAGDVGPGQSLVPAIGAEEGRLEAMLEATHAKVEQRLRAARREADGRIERATSETPKLMAARRGEMFERIRADATSELEEADREADALYENARLNMAKAVEYVLSLVLGEPGGVAD